MLRLLLLALVLANVGFFAWSQGLLAEYGLAPVQQSEPQRLLRQVQPEAIRLLRPTVPAGAGIAPQLPETTASATLNAPVSQAPAPAASAAPLAAEASGTGILAAVVLPGTPPSLPATVPSPSSNTAPGACLQSGFYTEAQAAALRSRLQTAASAAVGSSNAVPTAAWVFEPAIEPARWIVYMGRYASQEELDKKRAQLRQLGISTFEPLVNTALAPGFSLGHFPTQSEADRALAQAVARGVRTARVLQERTEQRGQRLKLPNADASMRQTVEALKQPLDRRNLQPCA